MGDTVPVGYRFHPTDEELVDHYLKHKLLGDDSMVKSIIAEIDVCKFEPWDLPAFSKVKSEDPEWFFFSPRELKYKKSSTRYKRTTNTGYWKPTGRDRNIKARGTDRVIGTKKTLVFHKGQPSRGAKTNWVIHEYHAATVPLDKRTFVLCRLMEKAEKKSEGITDDVPVNDEEPVAADYEEQAPVDRFVDEYAYPDMNLEFLAPPQAYESDFSSIQFSPIVTEQEPCVQGSLFTQQIPLDAATEEEDDVDYDSFLESILHDAYDDDDDDVFLSLPFRKFGSTMDITALCNNEDPVSSGCQVMKMVKTSQDATYTKTEANREQKDGTSGDNLLGADTSDDSMAIAPLSICYLQSFRSPSPPMAIPSTSRRVKTKYHPRFNKSVSQGASSRRSQTLRKLSSKAESQHEVRKEAQMVESNKDQKKTQDAGSRKNSETTSKGCFIYQETPSMTQKSNPRSVYLINVVVGFSLLIVTICDMVSFGKC